MDALNTLRGLALRHDKGAYEEILPGLRVGRLLAASTPVPMIYEPMVCLVLSGAKRVSVGEKTIDYGEGQHLVSMVDMPVAARVIASPRTGDYLALVLKLEPLAVADLAMEVGVPSGPRSAQNFCVASGDALLLDAWRRLLELLDRPDEIAFLTPMIQREILFRLMRGPQGPVLSQIATADASVRKIRSIAAWIRTNHAQAMTIEQLADQAAMSVSVFHRRFKEVMGRSPLQYQKTVRLFEARGRLVASRRDASGVAYAVGYESASQFSREYKRQFGVSPSEDLARHAA